MVLHHLDSPKTNYDRKGGPNYEFKLDAEGP